jgi:uncharacterized protein
MNSLLWRLFLVAIGLAAIAYVCLCLLLVWRQTRFVFFPSPIVNGTPADLNVPYTDLWLPVKQGDRVERIHGWWMPQSSDLSSGQSSQQRVLLYLHGNGINIGANLEHAHRFYQMGFSVLLIDYRGYGQSEGGFPDEQSVYLDAQTAWNYLTQERQIPPEQILIYGHSLGGAIAIDLALQTPNAAGLIVQSSFTSIRDMVDRVAFYRLFPANLLLHQRFDSIRKVRSLQLPVLFIHGTADFDVPSDMSEALYKAAPQPKQLYLVPQAGHNDVAQIAGDEYFQVVQEFLDRTAIASSP